MKAPSSYACSLDASPPDADLHHARCLRPWLCSQRLCFLSSLVFVKLLQRGASCAASLYSTLSPLIPAPGCPLAPRGPSKPRSPCEGGQRKQRITELDFMTAAASRSHFYFLLRKTHVHTHQTARHVHTSFKNF